MNAKELVNILDNLMCCLHHQYRYPTLTMIIFKNRVGCYSLFHQFNKHGPKFSITYRDFYNFCNIDNFKLIICFPLPMLDINKYRNTFDNLKIILQKSNVMFIAGLII